MEKDATYLESSDDEQYADIKAELRKRENAITHDNLDTMRQALHLMELDNSASRADIKKAFRTACKKYHPDMGEDYGDKIKVITSGKALLEKFYEYIHMVKPVEVVNLSSDESDIEMEEEKEEEKREEDNEDDTNSIMEEDERGEESDEEAEGNSDEEKDKFVCTTCQYEAKDLKALKKHRRDHRNKDKFRCTICQLTFSRKFNLQRHKITHKRRVLKPHTCDKCKKAFTHKAGLKRHLSTHMQEKKFACPSCGNLYSLRHNMRRHWKKC